MKRLDDWNGIYGIYWFNNVIKSIIIKTKVNYYYYELFTDVFFWSRSTVEWLNAIKQSDIYVWFSKDI